MTRIQSVLLAGVALLSLSGLGTTAFALPMKAVYTGTVSGSNDVTNTFGAGNTGLDGLTYSLTFFYDPATPGAGRYTAGPSDIAYGGSAYGGGLLDPVSSALLTINGHTEAVLGSYQGYASNYGNYYAQRQAIDYSDNGSQYVYRDLSAFVNDFSNGLPIDLETPFSSSIFSSSSGAFYLYNYDYALSQYSTYATGSLTPASLTVTRVSAVPLPAALPLFVAGLGGLALMRRRKSRTTT
jgi:hypothetical protein